MLVGVVYFVMYVRYCFVGFVLFVAVCPFDLFCVVVWFWFVLLVCVCLFLSPVVC